MKEWPGGGVSLLTQLVHRFRGKIQVLIASNDIVVYFLS